MMDRATEISLIRRALDHLAAGSTDMAPAGHRRPVGFYTDPRQFARERDALFRGLPVAVGHAHDVEAPGDFITHDLSGIPIVVLRGRDGVLRAFINACRHRGTKVEWQACGHARRTFVCPYHAWTYDDSGALAPIPHGEGFPGLDRAAHALVPLPVAARAGMVFVTPTPAPVPAPLEDGNAAAAAALEPLAGEVETLGLGAARPYAARRYDLACNWKLVIDASLDSYHLRHAHRRTIASMFLDTLCVFDRFGANSRLLLAKRSIGTLRELAPAGWRLRDHGNLLYFFFPGTILLVEPDHVQALTVWPTAPDRCVVTGATLLPATPETRRARAHWDRNVHIFWSALAEDFALMESKQSTLGSGANTHLTFGRFEHASAWFHEAIDGVLAQAG